MQQFLTNLLPGLRDLRAPLAAGYLWVAFIWLLIADRTSGLTAESGPVGAVYELLGILGPISAGIVISFAAYLLGAISETGLDMAFRWTGRLSRSQSQVSTKYQVGISSESRDAIGEHIELKIRDIANKLEGNVVWFVLRRYPLAERIYRDLRERIDAILAGPEVPTRVGDEIRGVLESNEAHYPNEYEFLVLEGGFDFAHERIVEESEPRVFPPTIYRVTLDQLKAYLIDEVFRQFHLIEFRLLASSAELFGRFDRLKAESELRLAVVPPLIAIDILFLRESWFYSLAILGIFLIGLSGWSRGREAGDTLIDALRTTDVEPPALQELRLLAEQELASKAGRPAANE